MVSKWCSSNAGLHPPAMPSSVEDADAKRIFCSQSPEPRVQVARARVAEEADEPLLSATRRSRFCAGVVLAAVYMLTHALAPVPRAGSRRCLNATLDRHRLSALLVWKGCGRLVSAPSPMARVMCLSVSGSSAEQQAHFNINPTSTSTVAPQLRCLAPPKSWVAGGEPVCGTLRESA